jgi:hypothetical protein
VSCSEPEQYTHLNLKGELPELTVISETRKPLEDDHKELMRTKHNELLYRATTVVIMDVWLPLIKGCSNGYMLLF